MTSIRRVTEAGAKCLRRATTSVWTDRSWARTGIPLPVSTTAYNAANELTQWGTADLFYDANRNMTSDGTNSFVWNARNQLASMNGNTISFAYDPFGRRVSKTISGATTNYLYDGLNPAQELSGTTPTANLLTGLGVDEHFTRTDSAGARNFLTDPLGSTVALADSTGAIQTQYTYEPFGNTTIAGSSTNPYQYTGRENDATGLYFYRARYYSSMFGRFVSQDPTGFAGGINIYAYVGNAPTDLLDPLGLGKKDPLDPPGSGKGNRHARCPPPTSSWPTTVGVSGAVAGAATYNGETAVGNAGVTAVVSVATGATGVLSNVGTQTLPVGAPQGDPQAIGLYAGAGFQLVFSNGQPSQLVGQATSYQISAGLVFFGATVAYSQYQNGVYRASFTPWPALPLSSALGAFGQANVKTNTRGFTTGCQ